MSGPTDMKTPFGELMDAHADAIRRLCTAYAPGKADGEDLFQDIWLAVWRALPTFRRESSARTWLYRIAHNVALTRQGRNRRRLFRETHLGEAFEMSAQTDLRRIALNRALGRMNPADRALTILWLEGLSAREIEDITGVKAATVAVRLSRIRKQLTPVEASHE